MSERQIIQMMIDHVLPMLPLRGLYGPSRLTNAITPRAVFRYSLGEKHILGIRLERALTPSYLIELMRRMESYRVALVARNQKRVDHLVSKYGKTSKVLLGSTQLAEWMECTSVRKHYMAETHYFQFDLVRHPKSVEEMAEYSLATQEDSVIFRQVKQAEKKNTWISIMISRVRGLVFDILYAELMARYGDIQTLPKSVDLEDSYFLIKIAGQEYLISYNPKGGRKDGRLLHLGVVGWGDSGYLKTIELSEETSQFIENHKSKARMLKFLSNNKKTRRMR